MGRSTTNHQPPTGAVGKPSWRLRAARRLQDPRWSLGILDRIALLFRAAVPVGLLRREEIGPMVLSTYRSNPDYYNPAHYTLRYEERILPALEALVAARDGGRPRLLDLYCGHGREAEVFARAGYAVTGVDAVPEVIERARAYAQDAGLDAEFLAADVDRWQPDGAAWDVVYTSLWMYSTVPDREARIAWVARLAGWPAPHGVLVISTKPRRAQRGTRIRHVIARVTAALTRNPRRPELGDHFTHGLFWHPSTAAEVTAELRAAHVDVLAAIEVEDAEEPCVFYIVRAAGHRSPA